jgi:hypothetical protein
MYGGGRRLRHGAFAGGARKRRSLSPRLYSHRRVYILDAAVFHGGLFLN